MITARAIRLLELLLKMRHAVTIKELAEKFAISNRTVRNDLDDIDHFLKRNNLQPLIRKSNCGIMFVFEQKDRKKAETEIKIILEQDIILSNSDRIILIANYFITSGGYVKLDDLAKLLKVSKNTVVNDINKIREYLEPKGIILKANNKFGLILSGEELRLRLTIVELILEQVKLDGVYELIHSFMNVKGDTDNLIEPYHSIFQDVDLHAVWNCYKFVAGMLRKEYLDYTHIRIILCLVVMFKRISKKHYVKLDNDSRRKLSSYYEYQIISKFFQQIKVFGFGLLPDEETYYLTFIFQAGYISNKSKDDETNNNTIKVLACNIVDNVIASFYGEGNILLERDFLEVFEYALYLNSNRADMGIKVRDCYTTLIKEQYTDLFQTVKKSIQLYEQYFDKRVTDNFISCLTIRFLDLRQQKEALNPKRHNILLVCGNCRILAKYIREKLEMVFDIEIVDTIAYHQIDQYLEKTNIDMIISTLTLEMKDLYYFKINPIVSDEDIKLLKSILPTKRIDYALYDKIIGTVYKYADVKNKTDLEAELKQNLNIGDKIRYTRKSAPALAQILCRSNIQLDYKADNWENVIRQSGQILYNNGYVDQDFVEYMVMRNMNNLGNCVIEGKGIALFKAEKNERAGQTGMSLLRLSTPLYYANEESEPINLIFGLAAQNDFSHMKALSQLANLIADNSKIKHIRIADNTTEIFDVIKDLNR